MSPITALLPSYVPHFNYARNTATDFQSQWRNPSDILSLLLVLGPDVIWRALAQLSGERITPVVFSYGWVAFAVNALVAAYGDGRIMPPPDYQVTVIGAKTGHIRSNRSWVIGRLLRDFESTLDIPKMNKLAPDYEALRVSVFQVDRRHEAGVPIRDWVWYSGFFITLVQIAISVIPLVTSSDWAPLFITIAGVFLAQLQGAIFQWREEKWACPTRGGWTLSLTQGNGSRNVMVILGNNHGLDLEILATTNQTARPSIWTRVFVTLMAILWLVLLVCVAGLNDNSWYLLAVGLVGMVHNLLAAGTPRNPNALGIHLNQIDTIKDTTVATVLRRTEDRYPLVGSSLVSVFFPGGMKVKPAEVQFWNEAGRVRELQGLSKLAIKVDT